MFVEDGCQIFQSAIDVLRKTYVRFATHVFFSSAQHLRASSISRSRTDPASPVQDHRAPSPHGTTTPVTSGLPAASTRGWDVPRRGARRSSGGRLLVPRYQHSSTRTERR